jgi:hypothetical protein
MQRRLPRLSPPGGCCVPPRLVAVAAEAVESAALAAVAAPAVVFAMTLAAPS